jgi:hypothetical protein
MKNLILAITRRSIPYVRELNPLTGGPIGSLLMQQLDFHFESKPDKFSKFLKPAPTHDEYVRGQSWTEELDISEEQFRSAFDKIGVRYRSHKLFLEAGEDPFQGKFYASWVDVRTNLTYYVRNHELLDEKLYELLRPKRATQSSTASEPAPERHDIAERAPESAPTNQHFGTQSKPKSPTVAKEQVLAAPPVEETVPPVKDHPVVHEDDEAALATLVFPALTATEIDEIKKAILKCPAEYRQQVLDEVEGQRTTTTGFKKSALAFARRLISAVGEDEFRVDVGARVKDDREKRLASEQLQAASRAENRPVLPTVSDIPLTNYTHKMKDLVSSIAKRGRQPDAPRASSGEGDCAPV